MSSEMEYVAQQIEFIRERLQLLESYIRDNNLVQKMDKPYTIYVTSGDWISSAPGHAPKPKSE